MLDSYLVRELPLEVVQSQVFLILMVVDVLESLNSREEVFLAVVDLVSEFEVDSVYDWEQDLVELEVGLAFHCYVGIVVVEEVQVELEKDCPKLAVSKEQQRVSKVKVYYCLRCFVVVVVDLVMEFLATV